MRKTYERNGTFVQLREFGEPNLKHSDKENVREVSGKNVIMSLHEAQ